MAYSIKHRISYYRKSGGRTTIDICDKALNADAITDLLACGDPLEITFEGDANNIYTPTLGSGATIKVQATPLSLLDLFTDDPQKFLVKIYDGASGTTLRWQGFINAEIFTEGYSNPITSEITIQCSDAMSLLDNILYQSTTVYTGQQTVGQIITTILSKVACTFTIAYLSNDLKITTTHTNPFLYLELFNENFLDENDAPMSCRQVLDSIIGGLGLVMYFEANNIYILDPINLHDTTKGKSYAVSGWGSETASSLGGYLDISAKAITWGSTGSSLDIVPALSEVTVNYDSYNFGSLDFIFSEALNWHAAGTWEDQGGSWWLNDTIEYKDWIVDTGIQIAVKEKEYSAPEYVLQLANSKGEMSYTFIRGVIIEDVTLCLRLSMQVYLNTKIDNTNIFLQSAGHDVNRLIIPIAVKVGDYYWKGATYWDNTEDSSGTNKWQEFWVVGSTMWADYLSATINDSWSTVSIDIPLWDDGSTLLNGPITVEILDDMSTEFSGQLTPITDAFFSDVTAPKTNAVGATGVSWARITDSIIEVTVVGFKTHTAIEARRSIPQNTDVTDIATTVTNPVAVVVGGYWEDVSHNATAFSSSLADTTYSIQSYTASTDTLVFRLTTAGTPYFGVGYNHIASGNANTLIYDYNYIAVRAFVKDIKIEIVDAVSRLPKDNKTIQKKAVLSTNLTGKSNVELSTTTGTGPYGNSRGAFKSSQITPVGGNITGLYRGAVETYYSNADLLLQSFMSQYKSSRLQLNATFNMVSQPLNLRTKLIKDTNHLGTKAFYMVSGTYRDREEVIDALLLELEDTRETIT